MKSSFIIFAIIVVLFLDTFILNASPSFWFGKIPIKIEYLKKNNSYYIGLAELKKLLIFNTNISLGENSLEFDDESLIFSDLSFFVVYKNRNNIRVAQMSQPCVILSSQLYLPILPFFEAMNSLLLINCVIFDQKVEIVECNIFQDVQQSLTVKKNLTLKETPAPSPEVSTTLKKTTEYKEVFPFEKKAPHKPRGMYTIPKNLKK